MTVSGTVSYSFAVVRSILYDELSNGLYMSPQEYIILIVNLDITKVAI